MKTIKNSDINFKIDTTLIDVENFSIKFYTVNSSNFFIHKTQDNIEAIEREATVEDEEVIKSGGTTVTEYFLKLDWSELETIGKGVMNYRCINNKVDSGFKDKWYNRLVEKSTDYYIDSDTVITADEDKAYGERLNELVANLDVEKSERIDADAQLDEKIDNVESSLTESINGETTRATEAENGLDTKITDISSKLDVEIKRSTDTDNALRQDLTDESELRSSADTAIWQAINGEITRSTNAETEIDAKVDNYIVANNKAVTDEIARATIEETRISNKLDSYITSNDTALNGEIERAKAKETEIESKVNSNNGAVADETSRAQARENEIDKKITDYVTSNNKALSDEVLRATTQENAISSKLDNYITSNDKVVNGLDNAITKETERATTQESAISSKLDGYITSNDKAIADLNASIKGSFSGSYNDLTDVPTEFTPASHTHSSSDIENLTGYAKGDDVSTIKATDSLNEALSKLENQIGSKLASDNFNSYTSKTDSSISAISETATNANSKADENAKSHAALSGKVDTYIESNNNALNNEITRATTQENALSSRIDGLASSSALESEIERAKAMETVLSGAIDTKVAIADYNAYTAITRNDIDSKLDATAYTPTDLTNYYTKDETYSKSEIDSKGYLTEHQDISGKADKVDVYTKEETYSKDEIDSKGYLTQHQDISGKLDVSAYTPTDLTNYYTKDETYSKKQVDDAIKGVDVSSQLTNYATMQWVEDKNYLTQHQDISGKADKADVYTKEEIDSKGYLTEHQDISGKLDVTAYTPTDLTDYYTKEQTYSKEQVDSKGYLTEHQDISTKADKADVYTKYETYSKAEIDSKGYLTEHQDISGKLDVTAYTPTDLSNYYTKEETYSKGEIDSKGYLTAHQDISGKADKVDVYTKEEIDSKGYLTKHQDISGKLDVSAYTPTDLTNYYTKEQTYSKEQVDAKISDSGSVDLTNYYTKAETYSKEEIDSKGYLTEHQDISGKADKADVYTKAETYSKEEIDSKGYLTEHQDISGKLDVTAYTPTDLSNYYTKEQTYSKTEIDSKGYLTEHQDISGKADKADVYTKAETYSKAEIDSKGYLTEHQDISGKLDVTAYTPTDLTDYYTKEQTYSKEQVDAKISGGGSVDLTEYVKKVDNEIPTNEVWQESKGNWRGGDTYASKVIITLPESVATTDSSFQIVVGVKRLEYDYIGPDKVMMYNPVSGKIDYYDNYSEFATVTINDDKSLTIDTKDGYKIKSAYATLTNEPVTIKAFIGTIVGGQSAQFIQSYIVPKIASVEDAAKQGFNSMFFEKGAKSVTLNMKRINTETMIASIDFDNTIRFKNDKLAANILVPLKESGYTQLDATNKCCDISLEDVKKIRVVIDPAKISETDYNARWFSVSVRDYDIDNPNIYNDRSNEVSYGDDKIWKDEYNYNLITVENIDANTVDVSINEPDDGHKRCFNQISNRCKFGTCGGGGMDVYTYGILKQDIVDYAQALDTRITTLETNGGGSTTGGSVDLSNYYTKTETYSKSEIDNKGYLTQHQDISTKADKADVYTKEQVDEKIGNIETLLSKI